MSEKIKHLTCTASKCDQRLIKIWDYDVWKYYRTCLAYLIHEKKVIFELTRPLRTISSHHQNKFAVCYSSKISKLRCLGV